MRAGALIPPEGGRGSWLAFFAALVAGAIIVLALLHRLRVAPPAELAVSAGSSVRETAYSEEASVSLPESVRAVIYARVSTEDQDLAGQERELRNECLRRGWDIAAVYEEKISATGRVERKEYERVLADARAPDRSWDHLLVWSLDRWSREERFSRAVATIEDLESLGVRFHSLREPMLDSGEDGSANMGRDLLRAILPVIAAFESRRKSERVRVAMQELKSGRRRTRTGRPVGRPRRVTPALVEKAELLRRQGARWSEIAQRVGLPAGTCRSMVWKAKRAAGGV